MEIDRDRWRPIVSSSRSESRRRCSSHSAAADAAASSPPLAPPPLPLHSRSVSVGEPLVLVSVAAFAAAFCPFAAAPRCRSVGVTNGVAPMSRQKVLAVGPSCRRKLIKSSLPRAESPAAARAYVHVFASVNSVCARWDLLSLCRIEWTRSQMREAHGIRVVGDEWPFLTDELQLLSMFWIVACSFGIRSKRVRPNPHVFLCSRAHCKKLHQSRRLLEFHRHCHLAFGSLKTASSPRAALRWLRWP
jgi:hypothetical protein